MRLLPHHGTVTSMAFGTACAVSSLLFGIVGGLFILIVCIVCIVIYGLGYVVGRDDEDEYVRRTSATSPRSPANR